MRCSGGARPPALGAEAEVPLEICAAVGAELRPGRRAPVLPGLLPGLRVLHPPPRGVIFLPVLGDIKGGIAVLAGGVLIMVLGVYNAVNNERDPKEGENQGDDPKSAGRHGAKRHKASNEGPDHAEDDAEDAVHELHAGGPPARLNAFHRLSPFQGCLGLA